MKRIILILMSLCLGLGAAAQTSYDLYVKQYSSIAVSEMHRSGVPASITLAQGLLESAAGQSVLARMGNNHFGIKCAGSWNGQKIFQDDDAKGECFRKYSNVRDSFRDHSDFLRYNKRYQSLFDLEITDYRGWAHGLKAAGYATDPAYPRKLIDIIERLGLSEFDSGSRKPADRQADKPSGKPDKPSSKAADRKTEQQEGFPDPPSRLQQATRSSSFVFSLSRPVYEINGVPFIYAMEDETIESIAADFHLFRKEVIRFNDMREGDTILPGDVVYLRHKALKAVRGLEKHVVSGDGETLRDISQHYAIKLKSLRKMNATFSQTDGNAALGHGTILNLR